MSDRYERNNGFSVHIDDQDKDVHVDTMEEAVSIAKRHTGQVVISKRLYVNGVARWWEVDWFQDGTRSELDS